MYLYNFMETRLVAFLIGPLLVLLHLTYIHNKTITVLYFLFSVYLYGVLSVVGLPNIAYVRFDLNMNLFPFYHMFSDLRSTSLNILLFLPMGFFLPLLWKKYRAILPCILFGFCFSLTIELLQVFTYRATDVNDLITNTLGTLIGWLFTTGIHLCFPSVRQHSRSSDLVFVIAIPFSILFFFQPLLWNILD